MMLSQSHGLHLTSLLRVQIAGAEQNNDQMCQKSKT